MQLRLTLFGAALCLCLASSLWAQDAVKVDPKHYTVVSENDQVRILKAHYGPHEKSVMHSHPAGVAVFLTSSKAVFHFPDGTSQTVAGKVGDSLYTPATVHLPENTGDEAMDVIVIELKGKPGMAAKAEMK
jgi:quercetin dioxygenase-like cupin family protein